MLVVDDQAEQLLLVRKAIELVDPPVEILTATSGAEALELLASRSVDIMLLDLNMPGMPGSQVLETLRADPNLKRLPVLIYSTSDREEDVQSSYDRGANGYITKPSGFTDLVEIMQSVVDHWFRFVILPTSK